METEPVSKTLCFLKKLDDRQGPKKKIVSVTISHVCYLFLICWPLMTGLIGCPKTLVRNYHSTQCNIPENADLTWQFDDSGPGLALHGPLRCLQIYDNLTCISAKFQEKNLVLHLSKYGNLMKRWCLDIDGARQDILLFITHFTVLCEIVPVKVCYNKINVPEGNENLVLCLST